ncbi:MAG: hypothetical protein SFW08_11855 [Gemmatimonadaceae bacterium]|nr:hypothetical protein [Gemmatimonadaceae bacterium]
MPASAARSPRRAPLASLGVLLLASSVWSCGLDKLTSTDAGSTVSVSLAGDSLLTVGVSRPFALSASEAGTDFQRTTISYVSTDTTVARVDSVRGATGWVTGRRNGTARIVALVRAPEIPDGRGDTAAIRVRYGAIRFDPIDTIAGLGPLNAANQRSVVVRGALPGGGGIAGAPQLAATLVSRDTFRLRASTPGGSTFIARDTGVVWLVASFDGVSDSVRVPIRRRPTRIVTAPVAFNALFRSRAPQVRVLDAGDSAIVGAPYRVSGIDTLRLQIDSTVAAAPRLVARQRDTASFVVTSGALSSARAGTSVTQVPASLVISAGSGQSARYGTAVPVAPAVIVRDSGGQGIPSVAVTFSVPNAGNGVVTGASQTTGAAGQATAGSWTLGPTSGVDSLIATVTGLPPIVITATALPGGAARVRFTQQPLGGGIGQPLSPAPTASVVDSAGNVVSSFNDSIAVTLLPPSSGGNGGTFSGRATVAAAAGAARFDSLVFSDTASALRLVAARAGLAPDTSAAFPVGRAPTQLIVTTQPIAVAGGSVMQPFAFELRDATGARAAGATDTVILSLSGAPAGMQLTGTTRRTAVAGRVTFDDIRVVGAGAGNSYRIEARTPGGLATTSNTFFLNSGPAAALRFSAPPASVGPSVSQSIRVSVTDSGGNPIFNSGIPIALRLATNPAGAAITDTLRTTSNGTAAFNVSVPTAGAAYRLVATSTGLIGTTSDPFDVRAPGTPRRLRFVDKTPASYGAPGSVPGIELLDSAGVRSSVTRLPYTVSIVSGPQGAVVTNPVDSVFGAGIAFPAARLRQAGTYRLAISAPGLGADTSGPIQVFAAAANRLALVNQPAAAGVNTAIPAVQVAIHDSLGNLTSFLPGGQSVANSLIIAVSARDAAGNTITLGGQSTRTTNLSIATFDSVTVPAAGAGYRLVFSATGLTAVTTDTFSIRAPGTPRALRVSALPTAVNGGSRFSPVFRVSIIDSVGTTVSSRSDSVFVSLRGPTGAALSGTSRVAAVNGVASFPTLTIARADTGLRLIATTNAAGVTPDSTPSFRVNVGPVTRLRIVSAPTEQVAGGLATPSLVLAAADSGGNTVTTSTDSVTFSAVPFGVNYDGTRTIRKALVNGLATFDSVHAFGTPGTSVRYFGRGITRSYTAVDTSAPVVLRAGLPARLDIEAQPRGRYFQTWDFGVSARVYDASNNFIDTVSRPVQVTVIGGTPGAVLRGALTTTSGVASGRLVIETPGRDYRLVVSAQGLAPDTSAPFSIFGPAVRAAVLSAPSTGVRGGALAPIRLVPVDSLGTAVSFTGTSVSLAGRVSGTLIRQTAVFDTLAVATFSDLRPDSSGRIVLQTGISGVIAPIADSVVITVARYSAAQSLAFVQQPASLLAGTVMTVTPSVAIRDSVGNVVADSAGRVVTLSLASNPGAGFLSGTLSATQAPGSGLLAFPNLSINNVGTGYVLLAATPGVNAAASQPFNVVGTADAIALRFVTNTVPSSVSAGATLAGSAGTLAVEVINSSGARVTTSTAPITLSVRDNRAPLAGAVTVSAVNGVATFPTAALTRADTGFVLLATSGSLVGTQAPTAVTVSPAAPTALVVLDSLPTTEAGQVWPAIRVAVTDAYGNVVRTATDTVVLVPDPSTPTTYFYSANFIGGVGTQPPVLRVPAVNGIATFTGLRPRRTSTAGSNVAYNYLRFSATGRSDARSPSFTVVAGAVTNVFPGLFVKNDYVRNEPIRGVVYAADSLGNIRSTQNTATLSVTLEDGSPLPTGVTATFDATTVSTSLTGTSNQWRLLVTGGTGTLRLRIRVTSPGLATAYDVAPTVAEFGPAARLAFTQQPSNAARNAVIAPPVVVAVTDTIGNIVTNLSTGTNGLTGTIELDLPDGATIGGPTTVLIGGASVSLVNGRATFPALQVNNAGAGFQLRARVTTGTTVPGNPPASTSTPFTISP